eukprot:1545683-Pleurochrysis_carterae.AAC.1
MDCSRRTISDCAAAVFFSSAACEEVQRAWACVCVALSPTHALPLTRPCRPQRVRHYATAL